MQHCVCGIDRRPDHLHKYRLCSLWWKMCLYTVSESTGLTEKHETSRIQKSNIHCIKDGDEQYEENTDQWKLSEIQHVPLFCHFFSPPTNFFSGSWGGGRLSQHALGERQGNHYRLSDIQCRPSFIAPGNLESPVHLTVGGNRHSRSRN